ncbi:ABC transporter permease [Chitinophaga lutea]|uniref:ABC transporter permease n=1 Tax=Chitinophaga lutea TaxID=2488634 RepID=A0A3N4P9R5_9BACT|nr:ABC transporter permease [Chitinophaga lutea]RPE05402.1 ABC transporter permease [Chitinophaga lutea]
MIRNYLKIAWRNLLKNKTFSLINITGLSVGMAVALLIGLWIRDEVTFNRNHESYDRVAIVMQHQTFNGVKTTQAALPYLTATAMREDFGADFKYIAEGSWDEDHVLSVNNNAVIKHGSFNGPQFPEILTLKMLKGTRDGLKEPYSIMLSASAAGALFGEVDPLDKIVRMDEELDVKVTGVYEDLPYNSEFRNRDFIAPWKLFLITQPWIETLENPWRSNFSMVYARLADHADLGMVSAKMKDLKLKRVRPEQKVFQPEVFLHPMSSWHLHAEWKDGNNVGGRIQFVWLFGIIGVFVLLLACINFMNLSTARSEKRAKEVGIRKAVGSIRGQLVAQFFSESLLLAAIGLIVAAVLVQLVLPVFNDVADKRVGIPYDSVAFWLAVTGFTVFTGLIAGSYPALYLSSFQPVKVLKGTFRAGRFAAMPRKVLVVVQFAVSVVLIIGTVVVFLQIRHAKSRPVAYSREGLVTLKLNTAEARKNVKAMRSEMEASGAVAATGCASSFVTDLNIINNGYTWKNMEPGKTGNFGAVTITHDYGKTIGWQIVAGRDFSAAFNDSASMVVNESAAKFMNIGNPVGETMRINGEPFTIIGVVRDMVMESPYEPAFRTAFTLKGNETSLLSVRINPARSTADALSQIESIYKKFVPSGAPFSYEFADEAYAKKFEAEQRIGRLSSFFAILAVFISSLGLFGMASFMAEQRVKEIGVRKVLGASVFNLWRLMSKDFVILVAIALVIAVPLAWYFMSGWLERYQYRTNISWWLIAIICFGTLAITLLTVSYQSIKAATANPVKSLRSE